jgi:hypothetical protein
MGFVFSNLEMKGPTLCYSLREPFSDFQNVASYKEWLSVMDTTRIRHRQAVILLYQRLPPTLAAALA